MAPFSTVIMPRWICNSINTRPPQEQLTGSQFAGHIKPFALHHGCFPKFSGRHPFYFRLDSSDHLRPCVHALSELSAHYGASVVLCTATQPALTPIFREFQPELSPENCARMNWRCRRFSAELRSPVRESCPGRGRPSAYPASTRHCAWSHPTRGGWIEIFRLLAASAPILVPPHTGWVDGNDGWIR